MLVVASKWDDVIPFEGVQKYVNKLKLCVKQHQSTIGQESGRNTWMSFLSVNARDLGAFTRSSVPRGTILFQVDKRHGHQGSSDSVEASKEVVRMLCNQTAMVKAQIK